MRTTLTLEPDVAALVKRAMKERKVPFKIVINDALRAGLSRSVAGEAETPYRLPTFKTGGLRLASLDDVSAVLDHVEGPSHK